MKKHLFRFIGVALLVFAFAFVPVNAPVAAQENGEELETIAEELANGIAEVEANGSLSEEEKRALLAEISAQLAEVERELLRISLVVQKLALEEQALALQERLEQTIAQGSAPVAQQPQPAAPTPTPAVPTEPVAQPSPEPAAPEEPGAIAITPPAQEAETTEEETVDEAIAQEEEEEEALEETGVLAGFGPLSGLGTPELAALAILLFLLAFIVIRRFRDRIKKPAPSRPAFERGDQSQGVQASSTQGNTQQQQQGEASLEGSRQDLKEKIAWE